MAHNRLKPNVELIVLPGSMNRRTNSVVGVSTMEFLGRYQYANAFMGAPGVSANGKLNVSACIEYLQLLEDFDIPVIHKSPHRFP